MLFEPAFFDVPLLDRSRPMKSDAELDEERAKRLRINGQTFLAGRIYLLAASKRQNGSVEQLRDKASAAEALALWANRCMQPRGEAVKMAVRALREIRAAIDEVTDSSTLTDCVWAATYLVELRPNKGWVERFRTWINRLNPDDPVLLGLKQTIK